MGAIERIQHNNTRVQTWILALRASGPVNGMAVAQQPQSGIILIPSLSLCLDQGAGGPPVDECEVWMQVYPLRPLQ
jgi:hypothetical protein